MCRRTHGLVNAFRQSGKLPRRSCLCACVCARANHDEENKFKSLIILIFSPQLLFFSRLSPPSFCSTFPPSLLLLCVCFNLFRIWVRLSCEQGWIPGGQLEYNIRSKEKGGVSHLDPFAHTRVGQHIVRFEHNVTRAKHLPSDEKI